MTQEGHNVLITGATGFLGTQVIYRLLKETNSQIMVLVRGKDKETALHRLKRAWWEFPELINAIDKRIYLLKGDITRDHLALQDDEYENLIHSLTHIIHTAADLRLNAPLEELRKTNKEGTSNILELANKVHIDHGLDRFSHVSTAYVAGGRKGLIMEDSLSDESGFLSNYEISKYESELLVKNSGLPISIFRPGMIVGDSKTGYIKTFNTLYVPLRLYLSGNQRILPVKSSSKINLIPVDYVADAVVKLTFNSQAEGQTFHLTAPNESLPTVGELITFVRKWSKENLYFPLPYPVFASGLIPLMKRLSSSKLLTSAPTRRILQTIDALAPYFNEDRQFSLQNIEKFMGPYKLDWKEFLPKLLEFAVYMGFFHRSDRTVHEQILFRLKSSSRPVQFYDIIEGEFQIISSSEISRNMLQAARSLHKLGIGSGDKVALVGFNSTRFLTLDVAIGLVGAVSVPLYYTSSLEEIKEILDDSEASALFIGIPEICENLKGLEGELNLISFTRESRKHSNAGKHSDSKSGKRSSLNAKKHSYSSNDLPPNVIGWEEFLNLSKNQDDELIAPVDLDDIATIRYTSGTTGKPRGVIYTHGKLRWMAEYIASMAPWKNRNRDVSYLSFLPMNHVVEGIMGLYGPYYAPAPLNIYFLENFRDLPVALPRVRPDIFFSVPRFYEKVWSAISENRIGRSYLKSKSGLKKGILRRLVKRGLLKRAGLDRCAQLIVGSAPVSEDLIKSYHDLGIEIHNAYGLTEAPLVTINRLGANRIGTVGEPLPLTRIETAQDGEVMVNGPQVMSGYYNRDVDGFDIESGNNDYLPEEGWLHTGDFGYITPEGSLVITGRKKEVIVNSYGKTISPLKIECMLKDIPGVTEALLIGEGKPYCSALLWFDEESISYEDVHIAINAINSRVSRPEEIKKWVALKNDLSIEGGDLTASLKLKRRNVIKRQENVINFIYNDGESPEAKDGESPEAILYLGNMGDNYES